MAVMADEELEWLARSKRRRALLLLVLGIALAIGGGAWLFWLRDYQMTVSLPSYDMGNGTRSPEVTINKGIDPRIFAGAATVIGAMFAMAGAVLLVRARWAVRFREDRP
jgi:ABC-type enterobactin transport system permease subunit